MSDGGVLLVVDVNNTRRGMAKRAVDELRRGHVNLLGVIVNRIGSQAGGDYYYQYYQSYTEDDDDRKQPRRRVGLRRLLPEFLSSNGHEETEELAEGALEEQV